MMNELIKSVEAEYEEKRKSFPNFQAGDTINVHIKISEGKKERIQQFQGVVLQRRHPNTNGETFTIRKISEGIGVERIFPILSPSIEKIELKQQGQVRRARLFYLQGKQGKAAKIKEKIATHRKKPTN
jgi:large subunit ribosomal protein L19